MVFYHTGTGSEVFVGWYFDEDVTRTWKPMSSGTKEQE